MSVPVVALGLDATDPGLLSRWMDAGLLPQCAKLRSEGSFRLGQNVRYTLDGTTPTASKGFLLKAGDPPVIIPITSGMLVKVIEEAASADLQYQWGK